MTMKYYAIFFLTSFVSFFNVNQLFAECQKGNCNNGFGELKSKAYSYSGAFRNGMFNGKGRLVFANGNSYDGQFVNGFIDGFGRFNYYSGHQYSGDFKKNVKEGRGKMTFANNDVYQGEWSDDNMEGNGIYYFADGGRYEGAFSESKFNGSGKMYFSDNSFKTGVWQDNKLVSSRPEISSNKRKDCNSSFCDAEKGEYVYADGTRYFGFFVGGKPQGNGITAYANGDVYKGDWQNGAPNGSGMLRLKNGREINGKWLNGKLISRTTDPVLSSGQKQNTYTTIPSTKKADGNTEIYSLVVGIANYNTMPSLKYTDDDAYQFYAFMKSPEGGAVEDNHISLLIDDAARSQAILRSLKSIVDMADADDAIIIYLSGHGLEGGFVPYDYQSGAGTISYKDILAIVDGSAAKNKHCIADACYSGSMSQARSPYMMGLEEFYSRINTSKGGTALIMSSQNQEVSLEYSGLRQGIFSHFLIEGLKGAANIQKDRIITVDELYKYISTNVQSYTANAQHPIIAGDYDVNMPVAIMRR